MRMTGEGNDYAMKAKTRHVLQIIIKIDLCVKKTDH